MRIAIVGAGAMGQLFGALLQQSGNDVTLLEVDERTIDAVQENGITVKTYDGEDVTHQAVPICRPETQMAPVDLVILFVKTYDSERALDQCMHIVGEHTSFLTLQNGLGNAEMLRRYMGEEHILVGITTINSDREGLFTVRTSNQGIVKFMPADGVVGPYVQSVVDALAGAGIDVEAHEDIWADIWQKCAYNAALNATSAVCRVPCGGMGIMNKGMDLCNDIIDEACGIAVAYGIEADASKVKRDLRTKIFGPEKNHCTSMLQDVMAKRRTECSSINGGLVAKARAKGIEAPYNEVMFNLLRSIESTYDIQD